MTTVTETIRKPKRVFTPEQKYEILKDIEKKQDTQISTVLVASASAL